MHDPMMPHQAQRHEHLTSEPSDERRREAYKPIRLDQLIEVDAKQLHRDAEMASEVEVFRHFDHMVLLVRILQSRPYRQNTTLLAFREKKAYPFAQVIQNLDLNKRLVVEALLIPDNLDSHHLARAMVATREHLSERALPERIDNLVPIREVIAVHNKVIPTIIVITKVIRRPVRMRRLLPAAAEEIRSVVLENLLLLVLTQLAALRVL